MMGRLRTVMRREGGVSILEMSVSMFGLAFVSAIMLSWFIGANRVDELHRNDDEVIQELRVSRELMTKDVRRARAITVAQPWKLTLWLDGDHDDVVDVGERVTWQVEEDGDLVRRADDEIGATHATSLVVGSSGFTYDDETISSIRTVTIAFVAQLEGGGERSLSADITLRNA
jgi:hypothetical protein